MQLQAHETELEGIWEFKDGRVLGDATDKRIPWLTTNVLKRIAFTGGGWEILYQDPSDGRYWELTFPDSQRQGGGPQRLSFMGNSDAAKKYNLNPPLEDQ